MPRCPARPGVSRVCAGFRHFRYQVSGTPSSTGWSRAWVCCSTIDGRVAAGILWHSTIGGSCDGISVIRPWPTPLPGQILALAQPAPADRRFGGGRNRCVPRPRRGQGRITRHSVTLECADIYYRLIGWAGAACTGVSDMAIVTEPPPPTATSVRVSPALVPGTQPRDARAPLSALATAARSANTPPTRVASRRSLSWDRDSL